MKQSTLCGLSYQQAFAVQVGSEVPRYAYSIVNMNGLEHVLSAYKLHGCYAFDLDETVLFYARVQNVLDGLNQTLQIKKIAVLLNNFN